MKKSLSILLCVVMLLSAFTIVPFSASAEVVDVVSTGTSKTSTEAVAWARAQNGNSLDYDGAYGAQCVDLIMYYYQYLGASSPGGDAKDYTWNALPSGWTRTSSPSEGDIVVWGSGAYMGNDWYANNPYGHIGIVTSVSGSTMSFCNQNLNGQYVEECWNYPVANAATYIHPNFAGSSSDLGTDFYAFVINTAKWKHLTVEQDLNVTIRNEKSNMCADQIFKFEKQNDGSYKIISTANSMCLDVKNASPSSGANVEMCTSNDTDAQRWIVSGSSGEYTIRAKCTNCVLDVKDNSSANGTNIQMCTPNGSEAQKFQIYKTNTRSFAANLGDVFTAPILNKKSWITLENNYSNMILNKENGKSNQLWRFIRQTDGTYKIYSCLDGTCIDLENALHENGTNIHLCEENKENAQRWYIYYSNDEYYFQSKESGMFFDIKDCNLNFGSNLQACQWNGSDAQIFAIYWGKECRIKPPELEIIKEDSNETTSLAWTNVYGETGYKVIILKEETSGSSFYKTIETEENEAHIVLPSGTYQAYIEAYNFYSSELSNTIQFTIKSQTLLGDADGDGEIAAIDVTQIMRSCAHISTGIDKDVMMNADVDGNGLLEITDATYIQRYLARQQTPYAIGQKK